MAVDYYNILKVSRTSGEEELRRAYKKLAVTWHPDKHPRVTKLSAEAKFKQICEAYEALSDPAKRQIYDLYGEEGLRYNVSSPSSVSSPAAPRAGCARGNGFSKTGSFRDEDIFDDLLGVFENNDKSDNCKKMNDNNINIHINNNKNDYYNYNRSYSMGSKKAEAIENKLGCSLEELYKGSKRKMVISRIVPDVSGKPSSVEEVLSIDIKPGWKKGTRITFPDKGNQESGLLPGDLIFVIDEKPHVTFKRDGNDLVVNQKISLVEALTGKTLNLTTLDGRSLNPEVSDIVKPGHEIVIPGEGMPLSKEPRKKGNLRIKFDVQFPSRLSLDQKSDIKRVLTRRS